MAERYEIERVVSVFENDDEFIIELQKNGVSSLTQLQKETLAELLLDNNDYIIANTVTDLVDESYIRAAIDSAMGGIGVSATLYRQTFYTYKYAAVKNFFRDNYERYLPPYDIRNIQDESKKQLFVESFMREYDRFSTIIDSLYDIVDIEKVPSDYVSYLAQLIGYERQDYNLISNISFKELLKNIIEIYRIKGTNYSFELFFGFLGFNITVREFWFDKRLGDTGISSNQYTNVSSKWNYLFYLTPLKPTDYIPTDMEYPYSITEDDIQETMNLNMFQQYLNWYNSSDSRGYHYKQLLGDTPGYNGDTYAYFKTNVIQYSLTSLKSDEDIELSASDIETVELYVSFLTPIFINARVLLAAAPYKDAATSLLFLSDETRSDIENYTALSYAITNIQATQGDTGDTYAVLLVSDPNKELYNNYIHPGDYIFIGDSNTSPAIGDNNNIGFYHIAGDTVGDSYAFHVSGTTRIKLKEKMAADQTTAGGYIYIGKLDVMLHMGDTLYPSGYHTDTQSVMYDRNSTASAYSLVRDSFSGSHSDEEVYIELNRIASLTGDSSLYHYNTYGVRNRDLFIFVDSTRSRMSGDTQYGPGDTFTKTSAGDSILNFGDSHRFYVNNYLKIGDTEYLITYAPSGDSRIKIQPPISSTLGVAYPLYNYPSYITIQGDSVFSTSSGFINPIIYKQEDLNSTSPITLGANIPLEVDSEGRPFENQDELWKERRIYYIFHITSASGAFSLGEIISGGTSGAKAIISIYDENGDSIIYSFTTYGNFSTGETITGSASGETATVSSIIKKYDKRGRILSIDVLDGTAAKIYVNDPLTGDSAWTTEFNRLTSDTYITLFDLNNGDTTEGTYRVASSTRSGSGDTVIITMGDSLPGSDQGDSGGYAVVTRKSLIKEVRKNSGSNGEIDLYDTSRKYSNLVAGDSIEIYSRGDTNDGYYYLESDATFSSGITTLTIHNEFPGDSGDSNGFVRRKNDEWILGDSHFPYEYDYIELIKTHI